MPTRGTRRGFESMEEGDGSGRLRKGFRLVMRPFDEKMMKRRKKRRKKSRKISIERERDVLILIL